MPRHKHKQLVVKNPNGRKLLGIIRDGNVETQEEVPIHMQQFVLDDQSRADVLDVCHELQIDLNVNVKAHHLTINYKPVSMRTYNFNFALLTHFVDGGPIQAARVDPGSIYSANAIPHITLSCADGYAPVLSNQMLGSTGDWEHGAIEMPYNLAVSGYVEVTYDLRGFEKYIDA